MLYILLAILSIIVLGLIWLVFSLQKKIAGGQDGEKMAALMEMQKMLIDQNDRLRQTMDNNSKEIRQTVDAKLSETHKSTQDHLGQSMRMFQGISGQSAKQIADVVAGLTEIRESHKQVIAPLQNLQDILKNPKQRGVLGEYFLESVLKNVLPPSVYKMQYKLGKDSEGRDLIVDAAIFINDKIIPIDSKFSLENYNRILDCKDKNEKEKFEKIFKNDLKERIDSTAKYIQPKYNTMDFAFMFIPSEGIYYELLVNPVGEVGVSSIDLNQYANRKKVNIVSPNSFYAFLQTVLHGLRQKEIEKSTKEIIKRVQNLGTHMQKYEVFINKLGNNLCTTVNSYESARKEFIKMDKDVVKIGGAERELIETVQVEKPKILED